MKHFKLPFQDQNGVKRHPFKPVLLTMAIAQALAFHSAQAASIEVTSNLDDGNDCTLRKAIETINIGSDQLNGCSITGDTLGTNDTITFGPAVLGQTITITQGELLITEDVSINPSGINTTIHANQVSRVMHVRSSLIADLSVLLSDLTITGGNTTDGGGGILVLNDNQFSYPLDSVVSLTLSNSTVSGNTASAGGGIYLDSVFGMAVDLTLENSTVSENRAGSGGGISIDKITSPYSDVYLMNSTVSGNTADSGGGGIHSYDSGKVTLVNSTVSGNTGDGIHGFAASELNLKNSTVVNNRGYGIYGSAAKVLLENSIIANNSIDRVGGFTDCTAPDGIIGSLGAGNDTISTSDCGGATIADPLLDPLSENGGATQTHALLSGSPAIDNGTAAGATVSDQRGVVAAGVRDSGAYEFTVITNALKIEKLINRRLRQTPNDAAQLLAGSRFRVDYKVTNNSPDRLYRVQVFEEGQLVCNLYTLEPGNSKQSRRCSSNVDVLVGDHNVPAKVTARVPGSNQTLSNHTNAYYIGHSNVSGQLNVTHYVNEKNADTQGAAVDVNVNEAVVKFRVENTGPVEIYRVKLYHDPSSPVNSGWQELCLKGTLVPGEVRYCKRSISLNENGLNKAFGRAQARESNIGSGGVVNASNPTYFNVLLP